MGRGVERALQARRLHDGGQSSGRRTLAVGARNQHARKTLLRMSERRQKHPHMRQVKFVRGRLRQLMAQRIHLRNCGVVRQAFSHSVSAFSFRHWNHPIPQTHNEPPRIHSKWREEVSEWPNPATKAVSPLTLRRWRPTAEGWRL